MSVAEYVSCLRADIFNIPHIVSQSLSYEDRPPIAGIVKGSAKFSNGSSLHFKEFLYLSSPATRLKYAYHYAGSDGKLIFRYDNARDPAARHLFSYPHHRHGNTGLTVSNAPTLREVLWEAASAVVRGKE